MYGNLAAIPNQISASGEMVCGGGGFAIGGLAGAQVKGTQLISSDNLIK